VAVGFLSSCGGWFLQTCGGWFYFTGGGPLAVDFFTGGGWFFELLWRLVVSDLEL
jgi:hypothetical protein